MPDKPEPTSESIGIPKHIRVKRRYTMSEAALEQRRNAAQQPKPGMEGKRNAWRHGMYATSFLTRQKPCKSTCTKYPCSLIEEGRTEPGGDCLDAAELLDLVHAVHDAIKDPKNADRFREVAALNIANSIRIVEMLQEDIQRDGTIVKSTKMTKYGQQVEYKPHPALLALPKLIQDLGLSPDQFMMTPKAQAKQQNKEDSLNALASLFGNIAGKGAAGEKDKG